MNKKIDQMYLFSVLTSMVIFPVIAIAAEGLVSLKALTVWDLVGKWFVFWGVGVRLLTAGIGQVIKPAFTAEAILDVKGNESTVIIRELGFSNICTGLAGVGSLFMPQWRIVTAFIGGLYMGIAGIQHIIKGPAGANETIAMISDLFLFMIMAAYLLHLIKVL